MRGVLLCVLALGGCGARSGLAGDSAGGDDAAARDAGAGDGGCATEPGGPWEIEEVDELGTQRAWLSSGVEPDGTLHVTYVVAHGVIDPGELRHATLRDGRWELRLLDTEVMYPSSAVGPDGRPHIVYFHQALNGSLFHATPVTPDASDEWLLEEIDGSEWGHSAIAVAGDGTVHVAADTMGSGSIVHGVRTDDGWHLQPIDDVGWSVALAVGPLGEPWIAYLAGDDGLPDAEVRVAHFAGDSWEIATLARAGEGRLWDPALRLDAEGSPHVAWGGSDVGYASLPPGLPFQVESIDAAAGPESYSEAIALDPAGAALVAFEAITSIAENEVRLGTRGPRGWMLETIAAPEWLLQTVTVEATATGVDVLWDEGYPGILMHAHRDAPPPCGETN